MIIGRRALVSGVATTLAGQARNLDRLAAEGMRFTAHHCNSPVCTPSRQSFLTGQLPHAAGVTLLATPLAIDKPTLAKQFQKTGYQTAVFGKMHFNRPAELGLHGFDVMMTEDEIEKKWTAEVNPRALPANIGTKPARYEFRFGMQVMSKEGAERFAKGEGRHGK